MSGPELEPLERAVLDAIIEGGDPALRAQLDGLTVTRRTKTGVGFFADLAVTNGAPRAAASTLRFGEVQATIPGLQHGTGFVLFVDGGFITGLEGYSYEEPWPDRVSSFTLARSRQPA